MLQSCCHCLALAFTAAIGDVAQAGEAGDEGLGVLHGGGDELVLQALDVVDGLEDDVEGADLLGGDPRQEGAERGELLGDQGLLGGLGGLLERGVLGLGDLADGLGGLGVVGGDANHDDE